MRRPIIGLAAVALSTAAAAAPAHAAEVDVFGLDTLVWDKPVVNITAGDKVNWKFDGTTQVHNVKSNSPNWNLVSKLAAPAPPASQQFDAPGTYRFLCEVHPDTMVGEVVVTAAGGPPPPPPPPPRPIPPSEQPFANDGGVLGVVETGGLDRTKPTLSALRVRRVAGGASLSMRVSELSSVLVTFQRGGRTIKRVVVAEASGSGRVVIRDRRRLRAGRYRVTVVATDVAGNRSSRRSAQVTLR